MRKIFIGLIILGGLATEARAQDPQFTQFYAAPIYHNPAFAGSAFRPRLVANYRNQWPSVPGAFVTYAVSFDHYYKRYNSGIGFIATTDRAGSGDLRSTSVSSIYSYHLELSKVWAARAGIQFGLGQRSIDYNKLIFGDQLDQVVVDGSPAPATQDPSRFTFNNGVWYFDASAGFLLYTSNFWFGMSTHHMNEPNQSLTETTSVLPMKTTFISGMSIPLTKRRYRRRRGSDVPDKRLVPAVLYKFQGEFDQVDVGCYMHYSPLIIGLWYRGLPIKNYRRGIYNHDAVAFLVGLKQSNFSIGYSYDLTVSRLGPGNTGGSHEISISYEFDSPKKFRRKPKAIPCPEF